MSASNKVSTNIEIEKTDIEATINMRIDEFKSETVISFDMKISALTSNKHSYSYDQPSSDLIKWTLLKSPENVHMHHNSPNIYLP